MIQAEWLTTNLADPESKIFESDSVRWKTIVLLNVLATLEHAKVVNRGHVVEFGRRE